MSIYTRIERKLNEIGGGLAICQDTYYNVIDVKINWKVEYKHSLQIKENDIEELNKEAVCTFFLTDTKKRIREKMSLLEKIVDSIIYNRDQSLAALILLEQQIKYVDILSANSAESIYNRRETAEKIKKLLQGNNSPAVIQIRKVYLQQGLLPAIEKIKNSKAQATSKLKQIIEEVI